MCDFASPLSLFWLSQAPHLSSYIILGLFVLRFVGTTKAFAAMYWQPIMTP